MDFDGVIFDMDGTLTEAVLDFAAIRAELGIAEGLPILETISALDDPARAAAERVLLAHELRAARTAGLAQGAGEVLDRIAAAGLVKALLTRNTREAMGIILQRFGLQFDLAWSREDGPIKPSPASVLAACEKLHISPARTLCVGDYLYDLQAANAAGCRSVLLARPGNRQFASQAHHVIEELPQLLPILGL
jgi:HAD superfamily hydrolase (TIGR01509 family)